MGSAAEARLMGNYAWADHQYSRRIGQKRDCSGQGSREGNGEREEE
jgi:hypothetical protein